MPITILDYVKAVVGDKDSSSEEDFCRSGVAMTGGCQRCQATIAVYNAYPSTSGYWRCADCIGDTGYATVAEFAQPRIKERFIGFLRDLANHLEQNTAIAAPHYGATLTLHTRSTDPAARAEVTRIAELMDAPVHDRTPGEGGYWAAREYTPLGFEVIALALASRPATPGPVCYQDTIPAACPACGNTDTISEIRITTGERAEGYALECGDCGEVWQS